MGIRRRRARNNAKTHGLRNFLIGVLAILALLAGTLAVSATTLMASWLEDLPDYTSSDAYLAGEPTEVYDNRGNLIGNFYLENRKSIEMEEISDWVIKGTIDTEDIRFYQHNGVDPQGIMRAVVMQLTGGQEGASTITQQLVRNTVLSDERFDITLKRKVREAYIAIELEKAYTKDQILLMYLNTIFYGYGAYGIEVASITFFNKHASELSLAEAALLVGLPNSPGSLDPTINPEGAKNRRDLVLNRMLTAGDITQEQYDEAVNTPLELNMGQAVLDGAGVYPYWTDYIKSLLQEDFSSDMIFMGGLKVYTTIDPDCQRAAEEAVLEQLDAIGNEELNAALVAIDVETGYIKAMVGGRSYEVNQFNLATQARRQPGSSFKAFTLAAAINEGMNPTINLNCNSPLNITSTWRVQNYANTSYGTISLARATELSSNTGYAQVAQAIGPEKIVSTAHSMGIDEDLPAYASLTLGTIGVPPIQMAEGFATLASGGIHRNAVAITRIEDRNGNTVYEHKDSSERVLDAKVAAATTQVLRGVVTSGTGSVIGANNITRQPIAGKTGTTENARDLWFVGYTPQVSVAVWTGYVQEASIRIWGVEGTPARSSCPIFYRYINKTLADLDRANFPAADAPKYKANTSWKFSNTNSSANADTPAVQESPETPETTTPESPASTQAPESPASQQTPVAPDPPAPSPEPEPEPEPTPEPTPEPDPSSGEGGDSG